MTFIEKFEEIKKKIGKPDISRLTENFAIQINLTDEDCGGAFYIAYTDGELAIEPYDYHDNTASVSIRAKDLIDIITGKLDALAAIMTGILDVYGNVDHAKALALLKKPVKRRTTSKSDASASDAAEKTKKKSSKGTK